MPEKKAKGGLNWNGHLLWGLVCAFLLIWAFVLGLLVGQGSLASPDDLASLQSWLSGLPVAGRWFEKPAPMAQKEAEEPRLSFYQGVEGNEAPLVEEAPKTEQKAGPAERGVAYSVQVASLKDENQAWDMVIQLKKAGLTAYIMRSQVAGVGLRYRVRVGPFHSNEEAQQAAGRIRLKHKLAAFVISSGEGKP